MVQLAKHFGTRVTAVCSTTNLNMVKSLGADAVIDYTRKDFSSSGHVYDMVIETVGKAGYSRCLKVFKRGSPLVLIALPGGLSSIPGDVLKQWWISLSDAAKIVSGVPRPTPGDLSFLKGLIEAGELKTVIDRRYLLDEIAEASRHAEAGHKKGHVLVLVQR